LKFSLVVGINPGAERSEEYDADTKKLHWFCAEDLVENHIVGLGQKRDGNKPEPGMSFPVY
jgi:hypothetical protein